MTGEMLRRIRRKIPQVGKSQTAFGEIIDRDVSTLSNYETGAAPVPRAIANLATALDLFHTVAPEHFGLLLKSLERSNGE